MGDSTLHRAAARGIMERMTGILIRQAREDDLAAINDIYNEAVISSTATFQIEPVPLEARRAWFAEHPQHTYPVLVAECGGVVVGWAAISRYATRCAYRFTVEDSIYLRRDHRRRGIGAALLARLIEAANAAGHHSMIAQIADHNPASIRLHQKLGFQTVGELREVGWKFGRWLDITVMQKLLVSPPPATAPCESDSLRTPPQ